MYNNLFKVIFYMLLCLKNPMTKYEAIFFNVKTNSINECVLCRVLLQIPRPFRLEIYNIIFV